MVQLSQELEYRNVMCQYYKLLSQQITLQG